ncbi:MAG: metallophosphoesterase [Deltaproteobacteria bacterium]|nr:metallophosphoesterase [Deltaproteobacteria bacterium]
MSPPARRARRRQRRRPALATALAAWSAAAGVAILAQAEPAPLAAAERGEAPAAAVRPEAVHAIYAIGDFGWARPELAQVGAAIRARLAGTPSPALVLELGDNVYESGLPADPTAAAARLGEILDTLDARAPAELGGAPLPLVAVPGNHDHDAGMNQTWETDPNAFGAIENQMLPAFERPEWHYAPAHLAAPGSAECPVAVTLDREAVRRVRSAAEPASAGIGPWACLTRPQRIALSPPGLALIAVDSQVLIGLHHHREEAAAELQWGALESELGAARAAGDVPVVVAHHPLESYGRHRPLQVGRFFFGTGFPNYTRALDYVTAVPGIAQITVLGWYATGSIQEQDVNGRGYDAYRRRMTEVLVRNEVALFMAGHDHSLSFMDLGASTDLAPLVGGRERLFQLVSGATANLDPLSDGAALLYRRSARGYARLTFAKASAGSPARIAIEIQPLSGAPFERSIAAR